MSSVSPPPAAATPTLPSAARGVRLRRFEDWPEKLAAFLAERRSRPFAWGEADCCLFAADWVRAATGVDLAAPWRGIYTDEASARALLEDLGGLTTLLTGLLGPPWPTPRLGRRGDIAAVLSGNEAALGIVTGRHVAVVTPDDGLGFVPLARAFEAWRVG